MRFERTPDRDSSAVHGMPGVAIALGGATHVLPYDQFAAALIELVDHRILASGNT